MVTLTYKQLMCAADMVFRVIQKETMDTNIIGLCIDQSQYMPAFLIGILKSGNAFVNFLAGSLSYLKSVLDHLQVNLILLQSSNIEVLQTLLYNYNANIVCNGTLSQLDVIVVRLNRTQTIKRYGTTLAYAITTSGTTGIPKIVQVPHRCIVPNILYQRNVLNITEDDTVFLSSPLTFDPSIVEIFVTLSKGASLVITSDHVKTRPKTLLQILMKYKVSVLQCTPTLLQRFNLSDLKSTLLGATTTLRVLALGGEKFPSLNHLKQWRALGNKTRLFNLYGITEVSCWSSLYQITESDMRETIQDVPIGRPITDTEFIVKDSQCQQVQHGKGLLYIVSSKRVCYINDEEKGMNDKKVLRSTGDIVFVHSDSSIVCLGREDSQVKRHGKRIDLTEIEQVICKVPNISTCKALFRDDILVAVIVPRSNVSIEMASSSQSVELVSNLPVKDDLSSVVKLHIQNHLPSHFWPDDVVLIGMLPMTKHGKCDVDELWKTVLASRKTQSLEQEALNLDIYLLQVWKNILLLRQDVHCDDMFVVSGGDSIKALQLAKKIQADLSIQLPWLLDFILHKSFSDIVKRLQEEAQIVKQKKNEISENSHKNDSQNSQLDISDRNDIYTVDIINSVVESENISKKRKQNKHEFISSKVHKLDYRIVPVNSELESSMAIRCKMKSVSRCNKCFDWLIHMDDLISDWKLLNNFIQNFDVRPSEGMSIQNIKCKQTETESSLTDLRKEKNSILLTEKWKFNTWKCVDASPLVASMRDGRMVVFIGSHSHKFIAVLLDTGQLLWEITLGDRIESSACMTLCGQYIVVGCYDYKLYILNSTTGNIWWTYETGGEIKSSPVVDPITSLVIFGSHDQCMHAVDIKNRVSMWCTNIKHGSVFSSPCVSLEPHLVICATLGGYVVAIHVESGVLLWKYNCGKPVFSSPSITKSGVCIGCVDGNVYHLNFQGQQIWKFMTNGTVFSSPTSVDNLIFIGSHDCHMYCLTTQGDLIWKVKVQSAVYSSGFKFGLLKLERKINKNKTARKETFSENMDCILKHSATVLNTISDDLHKQNNIALEKGSIVLPETNVNCENFENYLTFASTNGELYILNYFTGEIMKQHTFPGEIFSSPVVYEDFLVVGCRNDYVYCLATCVM